MLRFLILIPFLAVAACDVATEVATDVARDQAKGVVNEVMADRLPAGMNIQAVTDCAIDNASLEEVLKISKAAVVGPDAATTSLIVDIVARPETIECILRKGL